MARAPIPEDQRKTPSAVSLSRKQRETFQRLGGSAWLQNILDTEGALIAKGRAALPHLAAPQPARRARKT